MAHQREVILSLLANEVFILTHEYSDKSHFQICGVTQNDAVMLAWINGGEDTHAYKVPLEQILPTHPRSGGWPERLK